MHARSLALSAILLLAAPSFAAGSAPDPATADAVFHDAQRLFDAGRLFEACAGFERSFALDPQLGRLLNVAFCHEAQGRTASASQEYEQAIAMAAARGQKEREAFAREHAAAVHMKLAFVRLDLGAAHPSEVWVDARPIPRERWWYSIPVDPGAHAVVVTAAGKATRVVRVDVPATGEVRVPVELVDLPGARAGRAGSWRRPVGLVFAGAGALALGAGLGFGVAATVLRSDADPHCPQRICDPIGAISLGQARVMATLSTVGLLSGAVLAAGSAFLLLTAPASSPARSTPDGSDAARVRVAPAFGPSFAGASVGGSW